MSNPFHEQSNPYAAPTTELKEAVVQNSAGVTARTVLSLKQTRPWVLFLGIMGILGSLLMFCVSGVAFSIPDRLGPPGAQKMIVAVVYLVFALVNIAPAVLLIRFSQRISNLIVEP